MQITDLDVSAMNDRIAQAAPPQAREIIAGLSARMLAALLDLNGIDAYSVGRGKRGRAALAEAHSK